MKRIFSVLTIAAIMASCAGGNEEADHKNDESMPEKEVMETPVQEDKMKAEPQELTIEVKAVGETMTTMAYEPKRLEVPAGAIVTVKLVNTAESEAMIHNFVVIKAGKQDEVTAAALEAGSDRAYIPENENIIAATSLAKPGETVEVEFTAPAKAGTYQFICTYPGHTAMKGVFLVK